MNNGAILDIHNTEIKIKCAPPSPFNPNLTYLHHLRGRGKLSSSTSNSSLVGQAWLRESTPASATLLPFCFLSSLLVFVSYRKMFLPFRHTREESTRPYPSGKGWAWKQKQKPNRLAYSTIRKWPRSQGFLLRL